jgi:hypothetical protein
METKEAYLHKSIATLSDLFKDIDGWFSLLIIPDGAAQAGAVIEFGRSVNGTLLRQRYEIPREDGLRFPLIGNNICEIQKQFEAYCEKWIIEHTPSEDDNV